MELAQSEQSDLNEPDDGERLKRLIAEAGARGDARLPPEPKLAELVGVTRGRLRTLLKRAEAEGLIWRHVGRGTFAGKRNDVTTEADEADGASAEQIIQARLALEPQLAAFAAIHANAGDIAALECCLDEMRDAESFLQWKAGDEALHLAVAAATHNPILMQLFKTMRIQIGDRLNTRVEMVFSDWQRNESQTEKEHDNFVSAIRKHDPLQAERLMRQHLRSVRERLFGEIL